MKILKNLFLLILIFGLFGNTTMADYNIGQYNKINGILNSKYWEKFEKKYPIGKYNYILYSVEKKFLDKCKKGKSSTGFLKKDSGKTMLYCYVSESAKNNKIYKVTKVADGDTLTATVINYGKRSTELNGSIKYSVRMIGVDTPETVDRRKTIQCYGKEASNFTKSTLMGKNIKIMRDYSQNEFDKYKRLLGYIYYKKDGEYVNYNRKLISEGYGFEYTYSKKYIFQDLFKAEEKKASLNGVGLWEKTACNGMHDSVENVNKELGKEPPFVNNYPIIKNYTKNCEIKGNISSSGKKQYYLMGDSGYTQVKINKEGETYFCNKHEAISAGFKHRWR